MDPQFTPPYGTTSRRPLSPILSDPSFQPASWREITCLLLIVAVADVTVYRGQGYSGYALLFVTLPVLFLAGVARRERFAIQWVMGLLLAGVSSRLAWCGNPGAVLAGAFLTVCFAMSLTGLPPWVVRALVYGSRLVGAGHRALSEYWQLLSHWSPSVPRGSVLSIVLPIVTLGLFGLIFTLANPDLLKAISTELELWARLANQWLVGFTPGPVEILFCLGTGWLAAGVLRPQLPDTSDDFVQVDVAPETEVADAPLFAPFRNTLVSVIGLFVVYLGFEFQTLWFREFPDGFHYSGYAHEGAAWLTVALGLATVLLSLIFRGQVLRDPRLDSLKRLAWIWSALNLMLAVAVIHRLLIYVDFNGMTRMRTIGFLGIASVISGFLFVVAKIVRQRTFRWLIRRHLWTVTFAAYLYCVLPVDAWINKYNVGRVLAGDPAPCVQIIAHPTSDEGLLQLFPLLDCDNTAIRDGVSAMLASELTSRHRSADDAEARHWTSHQCAGDELLDRLEAESARWPANSNSNTGRSEAINAFRDYAWQWY